MNYFFKKILLSVSVFSFTTSYADIPPMESVDIWEATKDEYKDVSPLWGFIALQSRMLEYVRFFGNFKQAQDNSGRSISIPEENDPIAKLIYLLFPSHDGVSFVANTQSGFVGEILSKNLDIIGKLVATLYDNRNKLTSFKELISQLEETLISPNQLFDVLLNNPADTAVWKQKIDEEKNHMSQETLKLYEKLMEKKGKQIPLDFFLNKLLTNINSNKKKEGFDLKKTIIQQIKNSKDQGIKDFFLKSVVLGGLGKDKADFFETLAQAFFMEPKLYSNHLNNNNNNNNLGNDHGYINPLIYPRNIVSVSLLAFFVKSANNRTDLNKLSILLKKNIEANKIFTESDYKFLKENAINISYEQVFLLSAGYDEYEVLFKKEAPFRASVFCRKPKLNQPNKDLQFPDCGETSLRNFFTLLLPSKDKKVDLSFLKKKFAELNQRFELGPKFVSFFEQTAPSSIPATTEHVHNEWAHLIFGRNRLGSNLNAPRYSRKILPNDTLESSMAQVDPNNNCDIAPGLVNMINIISTFIPDRVLRQSWGTDSAHTVSSQKIKQKLDRLCELMSTPEHKISWKSHPSKVQNISTITFFINDQLAYAWEFTQGHFNFQLVSISQNDWRNQYASFQWQNEWLASLYSIADPFDNNGETSLPTFFHTMLYHPSLRKENAQGIIDRINMFLMYNAELFYPLAVKWIKKHILDYQVAPGLELLLIRIQNALFKVLNAPSNTKGVIIFLKKLHDDLSEKDFIDILTGMVNSWDIHPDVLEEIIQQEYYGSDQRLINRITEKADLLNRPDLVERIIQSGKKPKLRNHSPIQADDDEDRHS